jgi:hypothetical protein
MLIDFQDKIELPDKLKNKYFNELQSLANLWQGMFIIYKIASDFDRMANEKINGGAVLDSMPPEVRKSFEGKNIRYTSSGNDPVFNDIDKRLLYSLFQWYAVSACNYVLLVGYLIKQIKPDSQTPKQYVENVIPNLKWFRDKIGAHYSRASNDKRDNEADRIASVLYQIGFDNGKFQAPFWQVSISKNGRSIQDTNRGPWSITEIHKMLAERYKNGEL